MKIIESNNIFGESVNSYLNDLLSSSKNFVYISPIPSIYNERSKTNLSFNKLDHGKVFQSKDTFQKYIFNMIMSKKGYLPSVDMYFILKRLIESYFGLDPKLLNAYKTICYELFDLYKLLIFHNINYIDKSNLKYIKDNYPVYCFYIFDLYNCFQNILNDIKSCANSSHGGTVIYKMEAPEITLSINLNSDHNFENFINKEKQEIKDVISSIDTIFFDGFIAFSDVDKYIIEQANKLKKEVIFITKDIQNHPNKEFLINKVYSCECNPNYSLINLDEKQYNPSKGIKLVQENFYNGTVLQNDVSMNNGEINFVEPFFNKYEEVKYITKKVSNIIKENTEHNCDFEDIKEFIENEIVIVSSADGIINSKLLEEQFGKSGIFIRNENYNNLLKQRIKSETIKNLYYDIDDFLNEDISFENGTKLNNSEKFILWKKGFSRISLKSKNGTILSSPVFEFIFQIYSIGDEGINIEKFKQILFSNWYYHTYQSDIMWSSLLGTFSQIEIYFKKSNKIEDWIIEIKKIIDIKLNTCDKFEYKFHPVSSVSSDDLKRLLKIMEEIECLSELLSSKQGNFAEHIKFLKNNIIYSNKISSISDDRLTHSQKLIKQFCNIIDDLISDSTVQNLDSYFFIKHLRNIVTSFEPSNENTNNNIKINIQSMLNLKHYKYVLFMGLENNKYPREHKQKFPLTSEIITIIRNLGVQSYSIDINDHNLMMENFFFKNTIDFTDKEIWFTYTKFNNKNNNRFSVYADDITTLFDSDINFYSPDKYNKKTNDAIVKKSRVSLYLNPQKEYNLKELVTFQLCPKLYYHKYVGDNQLSYKTENQLNLYAESILYYDLFNRFKEYNYENKKWYSASNKEVYKVLENLLEFSFSEIMNNFSFINFSKLEAIKERCFSRIIKFIENYVIDTLEYYNYTIVNSKGQSYQLNDFILNLNYDTAIFCKNKKKAKSYVKMIYIWIFLLLNVLNEKLLKNTTKICLLNYRKTINL